MSSPHTCHAILCEIPVKPKLFMCPRHWATLPKLKQARIWQTYRPGQEQDKRPSVAYLAAAHDAIHWLHQHEGKPGLHCPVCIRPALEGRDPLLDALDQARENIRDTVAVQRAGEREHGPLAGLHLR